MPEQDGWDIDQAIGQQTSHYEVDVTSKDIILYSLGLGFQ
jgi:hypothetical protein